MTERKTSTASKSLILTAVAGGLALAASTAQAKDTQQQALTEAEELSLTCGFGQYTQITCE